MNEQEWNQLSEANMNLFRSLDVPEIKTEIGPTQYLDQLKADDLPANVCKGVDANGREFIAIKVKTSYRDYEKGLSAEDKKEFENYRSVLVSFRRYSNRGDWVICGVDNSNPVSPKNEPPFSDPTKLQRLIDGEVMSHEDFGETFTIEITK